MASALTLGEFLQSQRARATPAERGLRTYPGRRRVAGLRRDELAQLAGVSVSYYTSLEQGRAANASPEILGAIARALNLDEFEEAHLRDLAQAQRRSRTTRRRKGPERVDPHLIRLLQLMPEIPAILSGRFGDILAWNPLGHALLGSQFDFAAVDDPRSRPNVYRLIFLDPNQRDFYLDWKSKAQAAVANLRMSAGRHPDDPALAELVGELTMKSNDFAQFWAGHGVKPCGLMTTTVNHPTIGRLTLTQQTMAGTTTPDQTLLLVTAEPGSRSEESLELLGSLTAR